MKRTCVLAVLILILSAAAGAPARAQQPAGWVGSWAAAQQQPEERNALPLADYRDMTLREIVHLSVGGDRLRIKLSNAFGIAPLHLSAVHLALASSPGESAIDPATDTQVLFSERPDVTIPAGAEYWSDAVLCKAAAFSDVAVSIHYDTAPEGQTGHPGSRATSYYVHGDATAQKALANATKVEHWYQLAELDVASSGRPSALVAFGDSITDGHGATVNGNDRWPDDLARRLQGLTGMAHVGVLNAGIGGNRVLLDSLGPDALARFDRDVLARSGVTAVILLEGINDLGTLTVSGEVSPEQHQTLVRNLIAAYQQLIERAHARGISVIGATILPDGNSGYYHPGPAGESDRNAINAWIREPGHFDGVADFDRAMADPAHPNQLLPAYDSGDHLHPSAVGYKRMADAIPAAVLAGALSGTRPGAAGVAP